ncbi:gamma-glutamyltransferase family protein [Alteribacter natronophilus]|uniref:gamma-glutamyltransferase family protein n=1 Tax=Alteribacter natronophilus TaxID=2583810 RepID=UPI00110DFE95|nr:gamma-glutamyltransferase [Alteribacter natronophilus]TMW72225.1 gamma-glutamyltransferase [Alteribacter natronophilus]
MTALRLTNIFAAMIFLGLILYTIFQDNILNISEPYVDDEQEETLEIGGGAGGGDTGDGNGEEAVEQDDEGYVYGVSAAHPLAVEAGMEVLRNDGNAVEAAIAVSFTLNVVEPYGSGLGGGGQMLVHEPGGEVASYDYRESSPASGVWPERGIAVPGLVAGLERLYEDFGDTFSWEDLMADAYEHANEGFLVDTMLSDRIDRASRYILFEDPAIQEEYLPEGRAIERHETLVQSGMARTLERIMNEGASAFYEGEIAQAFVDNTELTAQDLAGYEVKQYDPVVGDFGDYTVYGASAPSSAATTIQMLQMAETLDLKAVLQDMQNSAGNDLGLGWLDDMDELNLGHLVNDEEWLPTYIHLMSEITKAAYNSRLDSIGDPEYNEDLDVASTLEPSYTENMLSQDINFDRISEAQQFDEPAAINDSRHTTHFVVVDKEGRMVSATHSLGEFFGSGRNIEGVFLNNQLNNFSGNTESPNLFEPGKRPRTFVSPIILANKPESADELEMAELGIGSPGGRRIPAMVFQTIMQYAYGVHEDTGEPLTLQEAISRGRFYTEGNLIYSETDIDEDVQDVFLNNMNYNLQIRNSPLFYGGIQGLGIEYENGAVQRIFGGGDPRRGGTWQLGSDEGEQEQQDGSDDEVN